MPAKAVAALALACVLAGFESGTADAAAGATITGDTAVTSARWAVVTSTATATPATTGTVSMTFGLLDGTPRYLWSTNTGTLDLNEARTAVTYTLAGAGLTVGAIALRSCSTTWNETTHACTGGTITTLAASGFAPAVATTGVPTTAGSRVRLQVYPVAVNIVVVTTIAVTVQR